MPHATRNLPLQDLADSISAALYPAESHQLLRIVNDPPDIQVARRPLDVAHPLEALLGFTAPAAWLAIGLTCPGCALPLDRPSAPDRVDVVFTFLLDRSGNGAGVMRTDTSTTSLPGAPEGFLGDACHRALGLPTAPPARDTVDLWLRCWLDRLVDSVTFLGDAQRFSSWEAVTAIHPVVTASGLDCPAGGPVALADATRRLAEAWPWARLRRDPEVADTPEPPLPRDITEWMDDGMYARWVTSAFPTMEQLATTVVQLLPESVVPPIAETVRAAGVPWPTAHPS